MDLCHELVDIFLTWGQVDSYGNDDIYKMSASADEIRFKAKSLLLALQNSGKMSDVAELYRGKLCNTIRVTIRAIGKEYAADIFKHHKMKTQGKKSSFTSLTAFLDDIDLTADSFNASTSEFLALMTMGQYLDFLGMIFEQVLIFIESGVSVNKYFREEGISLRKDTAIEKSSFVDRETVDDIPDIQSQTVVLHSATEVASKAVSEILRVRKETNAPKIFEDIKRLWEICLQFIQKIETLSSSKCYGLRSALMGLLKSFIEQRHESNLANLASTLEGENWVQCDVRLNYNLLLFSLFDFMTKILVLHRYQWIDKLTCKDFVLDEPFYRHSKIAVQPGQALDSYLKRHRTPWLKENSLNWFGLVSFLLKWLSSI